MSVVTLHIGDVGNVEESVKSDEKSNPLADGFKLIVEHINNYGYSDKDYKYLSDLVFHIRHFGGRGRRYQFVKIDDFNDNVWRIWNALSLVLLAGSFSCLVVIVMILIMLIVDSDDDDFALGDIIGIMLVLAQTLIMVLVWMAETYMQKKINANFPGALSLNKK